LPLKEFIRKRNVMIQNAKGNIILAGQSLENAFDIREDNESIVNSIKHNKNIKNIDIFLTDTPYIKGTIEEILDPVALFSSDTEGAVKYYVSGEEN